MDLADISPVVLTIGIFLARIVDVSLGTLRTILVFRGYRTLAAAIGFVEVLIWIVAAGSVLQNLDRWYLAVAYAGGFAAGNVVGIWLEAKLAIGSELVRAISRDTAVDVSAALGDLSYPVVTVSGRGVEGDPVEIVFVVERRRRIPKLVQRILHADPEAVVTLSDVKRPAVRPTVPSPKGPRKGK